MAKKPKGKIAPKVKPQSRKVKRKKQHRPSKYNRFQSILSDYKKESGVDFRGQNFNSVASAMWKKSKHMPLTAIRGSIDILFENSSGINPPVDISGIPQNVNYWALKDVVQSIGANVNIIVDNTIFEGIPDYEGKAGEFMDSGAGGDMVRALNQYMKENHAKDAEQRYSVYISEVEPDGSIRITLSSAAEMAEISEPGEEPVTEPKIIPIGKPEKPSKKEKEIPATKLKIVKERIRLEKQKEKTSKQKEKTEKQIEKTLKSKIKLADKALQLRKAGFSKKEILTLLGK